MFGDDSILIFTLYSLKTYRIDDDDDGVGDKRTKGEYRVAYLG